MTLLHPWMLLALPLVGVPVLIHLVRTAGDPALRRAAMWSLARYDDPRIPGAVLSALPKLKGAVRLSAMNVLTTRPAWALALIERMGVDRWLAILGANRRLPGRFAVVDAGSALTIDIVADSGHHEGGYIIPGLELMERALLLDTDRVRFEEEAGYELRPGRSTAEAVRHGIAVAQAGAVGLALKLAGVAPKQRLFCGGGAPSLMNLLATTEHYAPDLIFEGLEIMAEELG